MENSNFSKGKLVALIISSVALLLVVAIVLICIFYPPSNIFPTDNPTIDSSEDANSGDTRSNLPEPDPEFEITLSFTGDMILADVNRANGPFASHVEQYGNDYFLEKVRHIFEKDDFTIVNLENVLSDRQLSPVYKEPVPSFWFKSPTSNVNILSNSSVEGVLISNNHIMDYGEEGYNDTVATVNSSGMQFGDKSRTMYFEKNGFTVAVICSGLWGSYHTDPIVQRIKESEELSDYQVVMFHGGTERLHAPEAWKVTAARKLVDNGADLVIGGHPHVLQPREIYNGVEIVYSLGNFCYGGHSRPENRTIIYQMTLTVDKDLKIKASESNIIPCYVYTESVNNYQPAEVTDNEEIRNKILDFMDGKIDSPV